MTVFTKRLLPIVMIAVLFIAGCQNSTEPESNPDARFLEFSISELPNLSFTIDHDEGFVEVTNAEPIHSGTDLTLLTASFSTSQGASVFVDTVQQVSGETINDFSEGIFYTVISEDGTAQQKYFVYLSEELPLNYLLTEYPTVQLNPSGRNPLSAEIRVESREPTTASIEILGDIPIEKTVSSRFSTYQIPVLGLYPDAENQVVLTVENSNQHVVKDTLNVTTEALPDFLPTPEINVLQESKMEPGMHFNEVHIGNAGKFNSYPLMFDNNGDIRWYLDLSEHDRITWPIQFNGDGTFFAIFGVTIIEYDMLGNELNRIVVEENNMHHEIIKLPNGNYVIAVSRVGTTMIKNGEEIGSVEDYIIEVDGSGSIVNEWDMAEILDVNRTTLTDGGVDWFHMNSIWYSESDNTLIISGRNQGVVKVDWENNLKWIFAPHQGWGKAGRYEKSTETAPFLLTAVDESGTPFSDEVQLGTLESNDFSWVWGQHAPLILPNGNLFIFDNGFNRNFGTAASNYSMGTEYEINEQHMTVKQVWSYGRSRGDELFSSIISDVDYLPNTHNRLFMPGVVRTGAGNPYSKIVEITHPDKEIVFESTLHFKNQLVNGQGWGNLDITYRAERIPLYEN
ncbi:MULTISPECIES: aryl-sulfate sulfotransferase [Gracilimonas]|uniref:Aryl-sulfate sulfotransferase n=1 Tax=Gracilimonas sediminicola TaxID=2952158 RepID=A0A9X2L2Q1_9BACT|nr:aryl-sulfate sulfotransferase [Gracilimonas sediminicola]MCP9291246.1 aryl-sulfate sulfotransferase [Gracilimonas sediminicola]